MPKRSKSYTAELAEWVEKRAASRPRQDRNVVAFLAVRADVKEAMVAGYALKTIWEHLHDSGKLRYRYETFLKHVRRHIKHAPTEQVSVPTRQAQGTPLPSQGGAAPPKEPKKSQPPTLGGFTFDAIPKKEDLI